MKPTLKLTLFITFISLFSPQQSFAIAERDTVPTVQMVTRTPEESLKSNLGAAFGVGLVFLIPTTLLSLTFKGITSTVVLSIVKGAAVTSMGISVLAFIAFFVYLRKLKKKNYTTKRFKFWDTVLSSLVLGIGLVSLLPLFYFMLPSMSGLTVLLKALNAFVGIILGITGYLLLKNKKLQNTEGSKS